MTARIIDGRAHAATLRAQTAAAAAALRARFGVAPGLAVLLVGEDPASRIYVRSKIRACAEVGIVSVERVLPASVSQAGVLEQVAALNADPDLDGILAQLPLPPGLDPLAIQAAIDPAKDVDGLHPLNAGRLTLATGEGLIPCTPLGCLLLLRDAAGSEGLAGRRAVVLGRSAIVGKPMAQLLLQENCTVTIAHSQTRALDAETRRADIVVAAVGKPELVRGDWIRDGALVIDVGIHRARDAEGHERLIGDVAFADAAQRAVAITPVPGGVGPMTIACLLVNTVIAAYRRRGAPPPALYPERFLNAA